MLLLAGSENALMIYVSLELASLSLYLMTGFDRASPKSAEAALKYFLFGGVSAAFTLFGLSLVYGLAGDLNLAVIAARTREFGGDPLFLVALLMTLTGFGFKIAAAPFHPWAPDVYEGAPPTAAAFVASGSKVASFVVLARLLLVGFAGTGGNAAWRTFEAGWLPVLAVLASLSMVIGNLAAIAQSQVRRLLAYSAVAHAGYALPGLIAHTPAGLAALVYYVVTYALAVLGAFGVVGVVERQTGGSRLTDFAGLARRSPLLSICLLVFLLSLAGIPPLAGFFGKFYLFASAAAGSPNLGLLWLVILAIAMSAVSLYYYLLVLKQVFVAEANVTIGEPAADRLTSALVALLAAAVIVLGCVPHLLVDRVLFGVNLAGL
jgi:NADH-quinone oxidoreductase subunit N